MKTVRRFVPKAFCAAVLAFSLPAFGAAPVLFQSTFDTDSEGWTAFANATGNPPHALEWVAGAGNPGGAIRTLPPSDGDVSFFRAPAPMLTALASAVGGRISWDISTLHEPADTFFTSTADIQVRAGANRIRRSVAVSAPAHPAYDSYDLTFTTADGWNLFDGVNTTVATQEQIDAVLTGATSFIIRAEYWSSTNPDAAYLDNVVLTAVPEPSEYVLILCGLSAVAWMTRRRRITT